MLITFRRFLHSEEGVTAIEYAIIGVAMSIIVLTAFTDGNPLPDALKGGFTTIQENIDQAKT
ncbi:Flp family type IVb pilin [Enterovibrio sp. ZSDZ42]|uniref:Flp family type IVb pilin n=1 Tax=Enterovibrio gelatinilyticus TaxID=2899819 RepID=A0ABT5R2G8_9GAMM|nr:Flp family type IVb pilin [Enterovibrio sp. ZSDZ42]MDD1794466.1 Flp family type IVb pilin [Enterovibrio sp. ZSDZ42]